MPRRLPILAVVVLGLVLLAAASPVHAQSGDEGAGLLRPVLDGDPRNPPRFRRASVPASAAPTRFGQLPSYGYQPGLGVGSTGFDSVNARRKKAAALKPGQARVVSAPGSAVFLTGGAASSLTMPTEPVAPATAPAASAPVVLTPRQLQPAGALIPGRVYNPIRPGAPPLWPDYVGATVATNPPGWRQPPEALPFDPLGIQAGAFIFRPAFEYVRGYDNNAPRNSSPPAASSWFNLYAPELLINSNWARHELTMALRGGYYTYDTNHPLDRQTVDARANLRIDAMRDTRIELEGRYLLFTDNPGSPNIQVGLSHLPIAMTYGATVGLGHRFNRFDVIVKSTFDRTTYNDSEFLDGTTASNAGRNFNKFGGQLRAGYEVTPGVRPFVEIGSDLRKYDLQYDAGGVNRTSTGYYGKVGSTFELSRKLIGEVALGYLTRVYTDPTLEDIRGPTLDASLTWLASALTTFKLIALTTVTESTLVGVSGSFTHEVTAQVEHAFRRWLLATLRFTRALDDYVGSPREDLRHTAAASLAWSLTRELRIKGEYRNEWRHSNEPGNDYFAHVWLLGLRVQR